MALTEEQEMLLSIIEFNQREIEKLLLSRGQSYKVQTDAVKSSETAVPELADSTSNRAVCNNNETSTNQKVIPQILISFFKDSVSDVDTTTDIATSQEETENNPNVIVDHTVPLPDPIESVESSVQESKADACVESTESVVDSKPQQDGSESSAISIPGLGEDNCNSQSIVNEKTDFNESNNDDRYLNTSEQKSNVWVINRNGKRRKKARSSSPCNDLRNQSQPSSKRKRSTSSSSALQLVQSQGADIPLNDNVVHSQDKFINQMEKKAQILKENLEESNPKNIDGENESSQELSTKPIIQKDDNHCSVKTVLPKKKTKILSSPLKRKQNLQNPKIPRRASYKMDPGSSSGNILEPYIACWAHCPAISLGVNSAHCVPKHQFMDHLREYHTPPKSIKLRNQQIVCICHACETVVPYNFQSKSDHLNQRCTKWLQQFFLFIENAQDNFAIPQFNAPVVKSPGLAGMFKSIAHHPHLDTLTWKNVKNEHFCYHFCKYCNVFVEDAMKAVSDHKSTALHRVNVRKSSK